MYHVSLSSRLACDHTRPHEYSTLPAIVLLIPEKKNLRNNLSPSSLCSSTHSSSENSTLDVAISGGLKPSGRYKNCAIKYVRDDSDRERERGSERDRERERKRERQRKRESDRLHIFTMPTDGRASHCSWHRLLSWGLKIGYTRDW